MSSINNIRISWSKLKAYIEKENFVGYDPYDTLNSWIPLRKMGKWPGAITTQIQKRNPINIRPILGIKKEINPKAFGLFLQTYCLLYQKTGKQKYLDHADYFFNWLMSNYSDGYSGMCWGYNFPWASPVKLVEANVPSSVVTSFVIKGIFEYLKITDNILASDAIISSSNFVLKDLPSSNFENGICVSYTPTMKDLCFNASLFSAEILTRAYLLNKNAEIKKTAIQAVNWVIDHQKENGKWNYSIDPDTGKEREQIDFHQGYILESIFEIKTLLNINDPNWDYSLQNGLEFYFKKQFFSNGRSLWRLPKEYPVEIHNQAQGIITFQKLKEYNSKYSNFSKTIAQWTNNNMQSTVGYYYYQNFKYYKNKIPYMRWNQAWMFLALTHIID